MNGMKRSSAPSMIDEASVRVASGLRPKQRNAIMSNTRIGDVRSQQHFPKSSQVHFCANPLDRMCELLLDWHILADIGVGRGFKDNSSSSKEALPTFYASHRSYVEHWEPLLIEEVKACILSNLPLNTKRRSKCGTAMVSSQGGGSANLTLMNLNCSFTGNKVDSNTSYIKDTDSSARSESSWRDLPGVMDLILLSVHPIQTPLTLASVEAFAKDQLYMLAMVTSNTRPDGSKGMQIKGHPRFWSAFKEQQDRKQLVAKAKELDTSKSSGIAVLNSKALKPSKSDDFLLHYIIIDGLTSSWREFLALHELSTKIKLSSEILATSPQKDRDYIPNVPTPTGRDDPFSSSNDWCQFDILDSSTRENNKSARLINDDTKSSKKNILHNDDITKGRTVSANVVPVTTGNKGSIRERNLSKGGKISLHVDLTKKVNEEELPSVSVRNIDTDSDDEDPPPPPPSPPPSPLSSLSTSISTPIIDLIHHVNPIPPSKSNQVKEIIQKKQIKEGTLTLATTASDKNIGGKSSGQLSSVPHITIQEIQSWERLGLTLKYLSVLKQRYNSSQLDAIQKSLGSSGFTLIQGPPGTGKTFTILGILNSFHIREYNKYYRMAVEVFLSDEGIRCRNSKNSESWLKLISKISKSKPHILAVAPSNVAVDNLVQRIMEKGFIDGRGGRYNPTILRLGMGRGCKVKSVSLEDTLEEEQAYFDDENNTHNFSKDIEKHINSLILQIFSVQTYLINLKLAFKAHPLPVGWELRVAEGTGIPYWIDHINRVSSPIPPARPPIGVALGFLSFETLPEYVIHEQKFTQLLDHLDRQNLIYTRYKARVALKSHRGDASARQVIESSIIDEAHIVFTTVNSSGHPSLENTDFCVMIIDEAAQCSEPSALIPLRRGCSQCIMVGDPMQLSAVIFSDKAKKSGYGTSLFERLSKTGNDSLLLNVQYRMDPSISGFASNMFYDNELKDGENVLIPTFRPSYLNGINTKNGFQYKDAIKEYQSVLESENKEKEGMKSSSSAASFLSSLNTYQGIPNTKMILNNKNSMEKKKINIADDVESSMTLKPFLFFDLTTSQDVSNPSMSHSNIEEAKMCVNILETLIVQARKRGVVLGPLGIITPYSDQVQEIKRRLDSAGLLPSTTGTMNDKNNVAASLDVEVNTVDSFQGREKDIIIISCVRANDEGSIGFLSDARRMNVALTRARYGLFVVACAITLSKNPHWGKLIEYAESHDALVVVEDAYQPLMPLIIAQAKKSITPSTSAVTAGYPSFADSNPVQSSSDSSNVIYPPRKKILKSKRIEKLVLNSASEDKYRSTGKETELLPSSSHLDKLHQIECLEKVHYNGIDIEKASSTDSDQTALKRNLDTFLISNTGEANDKDHGLPSSKRLNVQLSELEEGEEDEC